MSRFKAVCNTGIEKDYYTFDGGWHTIKHPGYYITQYMRATSKTTREMTQWVKTSDSPGAQKRIACITAWPRSSYACHC